MKTSRRLALAALFVMVAAVIQPPRAWSDGIVTPGETREFSQADDGDGTLTYDTIFAWKDCRFIPADSSAEASAVLAVGALNYTITSYCSVFTDFAITSASSGDGTVLDATVSAEVDWNGILWGLSFLGNGASVTIDMALIDTSVNPPAGTPTGQIQVASKTQEGANLVGFDAGGTIFNGARTVSFPGKVVRGHNYSIELRVTCELESGLLGAELGCDFQKGDVFHLGLSGDRYVRWNKLSITVEQDLNERFDVLEGKIDALDMKVDALDTKIDALDMKVDGLGIKVDALDTKLDEVLRLLHTPPGLRETEVPACQGSACNFPQNPRKN